MPPNRRRHRQSPPGTTGTDNLSLLLTRPINTPDPSSDIDSITTLHIACLSNGTNPFLALQETHHPVVGPVRGGIMRPDPRDYAGSRRCTQMGADVILRQHYNAYVLFVVQGCSRKLWLLTWP